jgi:hypothetical protein
MVPHTSATALAIMGPLFRRIDLLLTLVLALPAVASAADWNILVGYGVVGPAQYDQGLSKPMMTVNVTGLLRVGEKVSFGGAGVGVRGTSGADRLFEKGSFDEFGLAVPFFTYRWGRVAGQIGVEIQRANLRKTFYYAAFGLSLGGRSARSQPSGPRAEPGSK